MSKDRESTVSRRRFAQEAGIAAVALTAVGPAIAADVSSSPARPLMASARRRTDLAKLSNTLYNSPDERKAFLTDPRSYSRRMGLELHRQDLSQVQSMLASGFCCHGCGCSGGALEEQERQQQR
jgi:hypothetical protein